MHIPAYSFPCSHDALTEQWNQNEDYEVAVIDEGYCGKCKEMSVKILTQHGAKRFGVNAGFCLSCINKHLLSSANPLEYRVGFNDSPSDAHIIRVNGAKLAKFLETQAVQEALTQEEIEALTKSVVDNQNNPRFIQARKYQEQAHQCKNKDCNGYILEDRMFKALCNMRTRSDYTVACFGCTGFMSISGGGCSILTCGTSGCNVQVCVYCINGATTKRIEHNLQTCSELYNKHRGCPFPRLCECKANEEKLSADKKV
jgi:hypothetical protein